MSKYDIRKVIFVAIALVTYVVYVKILRVSVDPPIWQYLCVSVAWALGALCIAVGPCYSWLTNEK